MSGVPTILTAVYFLSSFPQGKYSTLELHHEHFLSLYPNVLPTNFTVRRYIFRY
jgi:hypothetical protein